MGRSASSGPSNLRDSGYAGRDGKSGALLGAHPATPYYSPKRTKIDMRTRLPIDSQSPVAPTIQEPTMPAPNGAAHQPSASTIDDLVAAGELAMPELTDDDFTSDMESVDFWRERATQAEVKLTEFQVYNQKTVEAARREAEKYRLLNERNQKLIEQMEIERSRSREVSGKPPLDDEGKARWLAEHPDMIEYIQGIADSAKQEGSTEKDKELREQVAAKFKDERDRAIAYAHPDGDQVLASKEFVGWMKTYLSDDDKALVRAEAAGKKTGANRVPADKVVGWISAYKEQVKKDARKAAVEAAKIKPRAKPAAPVQEQDDSIPPAARRQAAAPAAAPAVTAAGGGRTFTAADIQKMDGATFEKNKDAIFRAMSSGLVR